MGVALFDTMTIYIFNYYKPHKKVAENYPATFYFTNLKSLPSKTFTGFPLTNDK